MTSTKVWELRPDDGKHKCKLCVGKVQAVNKVQKGQAKPIYCCAKCTAKVLFGK